MSSPSRREALELLTTAGTHLAPIRVLAESGADKARDEHDPEELAAAFRAVHSLASVLPTAARDCGHVLCNRVDDMRMAKLPLSPANLDRVLASIEGLSRALDADPPSTVTLAAIERDLAELGRPS